MSRWFSRRISAATRTLSAGSRAVPISEAPAVMGEVHLHQADVDRAVAAAEERDEAGSCAGCAADRGHRTPFNNPC